MRIYRPPSPNAIIAAILFCLSGFFASLAATALPQALSQHVWVAYPLFIICILVATVLLFRAQRPARSVSPLEKEYEDYLYYYGETAASIRLVGAADEWFPPECVHVVPRAEPYALPDEFLTTRNEVVARLKDEATKHNRLFFDGPNTRLIDYTSSPVEETEQKHLNLVLGPVSWYDYSITRWYLKRYLQPLDREWLRQYINLDEVAKAGVIKNNAFTNILCTATTFITADGYVTYSKRSDRVSSQSLKYTSCVAENIHQQKDRSLESGIAGLPAPYRAAIRGIEEEVSPRLAELVRAEPRHLLLLGMDFDLESFQPDLLFLLVWPGKYADIEAMVKENPGRDFVEGCMQVVKMRRGDLVQLLAQPEWVPGGKASVIRAIEFIDMLRVKYRGQTLTSILESVVAGTLPVG